MGGLTCYGTPVSPCFKDEPGAHLDPPIGAEDDRLNGVSGSTSSAALHHAAGPKRRRHRIPRQEKDKDQQVDEQQLLALDVVHSSVLIHSVSYDVLCVVCVMWMSCGCMNWWCNGDRCH